MQQERSNAQQEMQQLKATAASLREALEKQRGDADAVLQQVATA